ncbi:alpha/beta hydrolase [Bradyrhizobium sp. ARR65]|uniref:alpha/beta fold hydrolase n=1 Tax=Bradyrhizobium sp. ARR65 TaxID=1040989 RepID=UPI000466D31E|nr:alpha/beta hydrolase [Bradyrhizobium sp. ARR65]
MINSIQFSPAQAPKSCVLALHCSLGSGRQWTRLAEALDGKYRLCAPDLVRHDKHRDVFSPAATLAEEVDLLSEAFEATSGPIHLVGHSYGGAIAFKVATASLLASRIRSLTLIEPVLPTLLRDNEADRRLHDRFEAFAVSLYVDLWNGQFMEAIDKFITFWNGSGPAEQPSAEARLRMIEHAEELAFNFHAVLAEDNVATAAAAIRVPTLLMSGGLSPYLTQRIVTRLAALIAGSQVTHLPKAGHMLPQTHRSTVTAEIIRHITRADDLAEISTLRRSGPHGTGTALVVSCPIADG